MSKIFVDLIEQELEHYPECSKNHTPNEITKKAIENVSPVYASSFAEAQQRKDTKKATAVEELFKN